MMTLSIIGLNCDIQYTQHSASSVIVLNVLILSVVMLQVVTPGRQEKNIRQSGTLHSATLLVGSLAEKIFVRAKQSSLLFRSKKDEF